MQEFYADFDADYPYHFTLNMLLNHIYMLPSVVDHSNLRCFCVRVVDGFTSLCLALKQRPVILYQRPCDIAKRIFQGLAVCIILYSNQLCTLVLSVHQYYRFECELCLSSGLCIFSYPHNSPISLTTPLVIYVMMVSI